MRYVGWALAWPLLLRLSMTFSELDGSALSLVTGGALFTDLIGRLGLTVNPQTGQRVRTRRVPSDDWGNTYKIIEEWSPFSNSWRRTGSVPGSTSGGHY